jgi:L-Ala-D/L-Glu epimerase
VGGVLRAVTAEIERWPLRTPFRIARGLRTEAEVIVVTISEHGVTGRGEGSVTPRYGERVEQVLAQARGIAGQVAAGLTREELRHAMPPGSARNAIDCALWDLAAKRGEIAVAAPLPPVTTAITLGIDTPERMATAAAAVRGARLVKVKVDGREPEACLRAVRAALPDTRLIVDANESWTMAQVELLQPVLAELGIAFLEQPLPAADDAELEGFRGPVPICADESCHVAADVARLRSRYAYVNIKLDKTGGLTEALALHAAARDANMGVMVGCMISTSLAIAPALQIAARADCADLDGPWWLAGDRAGGVGIAPDGSVTPPAPDFWGPPGLIDTGTPD